MSYQVLARKWRPGFFKDLVGQEAVVQALVNGLDNDRVHHAFLLTGTRGVGKTTLARILAKCLNCETGVTSTPCGECGSCVDIDQGRFVDMLEIDAASRTKVDDTRELLESVQFTPTRGRYKVYIIDEVHMLSTSSFNALLKTLEEPPPHVKFVLATTDAQKIPVTILSRCLRFNLRRLLPDQISGYLEKILASESIEAEATALTRIARAADGSMRDGLSLLDQAIAYGGGKLKDAEVAEMLGSVDHAHVAAMIEAVIGGKAETLLEIVAELAAQARDLESVLHNIAEVLHRINLLQCAPAYRDPERSDWESIAALAEKLAPEDAQLYYQIAIQGAKDLGLAPDPRTGLEMTLLRMLVFRPAGQANAATPAAAGPAKKSAAGAKPKAAGAAASRPAAAPKHSAASDKASPEKRPSKPSAPAGVAPALAAGVSSAAPLPIVNPSAAGQISEGADERTDDWLALLPQLDLNGPLRELARNVHFDSREQDRWHFLIPETVQHLGSPAMVKKLQAVISAHLGKPVKLTLKAVRQALATPAAVTEKAVKHKMSEAEKAIDSDPTVQALKQRLGAQIIEDSVQPLQ